MALYDIIITIPNPKNTIQIGAFWYKLFVVIYYFWYHGTNRTTLKSLTETNKKKKTEFKLVHFVEIIFKLTSQL